MIMATLYKPTPEWLYLVSFLKLFMDKNRKNKLFLTIFFDMFVHKLIGVAYKQIGYTK